MGNQKLFNQIIARHNLKLRLEKDLTNYTDDPNNTSLILFFLYPIDEIKDYHKFNSKEFHNEIIEDLKLIYDDSGDHSEELSIIAQNDELVLILNLNK